MAEFESDQDAVTALVAAAKSGQFPHLIQRMRDDRAEAQLLDAARAELLEAGVPVIERSDLVWPAQRLDNLTVLGVDIADHHECDGHAAFLGWQLDDDRRRVPTPVYVCVDAVANGHVPADGRRTEPRKGSLTEEQKAERRRVVALNRAWSSATSVRREWITAFAARKTAPAGSELFVLTALLAGDHEIKQAIEAHWPMLRDLLGITDHQSPDAQAWITGPRQCTQIAEQLAKAPAGRVLVVLVTAVLSAWETKTGPHTWRRGSTETERYLTQLESWGYPLAPIECLARGENIPDTEFGLGSTGDQPPTTSSTPELV